VCKWKDSALFHPPKGHVNFLWVAKPDGEDDFSFFFEFQQKVSSDESLPLRELKGLRRQAREILKKNRHGVMIVRPDGSYYR
jgi:hypothetical protein